MGTTKPEEMKTKHEKIIEVLEDFKALKRSEQDKQLDFYATAIEQLNEPEGEERYNEALKFYKEYYNLDGIGGNSGIDRALKMAAGLQSTLNRNKVMEDIITICSLSVPEVNEHNHILSPGFEHLPNDAEGSGIATDHTSLNQKGEWKTVYHKFRCNKCGFEFTSDDLWHTYLTCIEPFPQRISGICGGKIELAPPTPEEKGGEE